MMTWDWLAFRVAFLRALAVFLGLLGISGLVLLAVALVAEAGKGARWPFTMLAVFVLIALVAGVLAGLGLRISWG